MSEEPIPRETRCQRGHQIVWDRDGQGFETREPMTGRVLRRSTLATGTTWRDVKFCTVCGNLLLPATNRYEEGWKGR